MFYCVKFVELSSKKTPLVIKTDSGTNVLEIIVLLLISCFKERVVSNSSLNDNSSSYLHCESNCLTVFDHFLALKDLTPKLFFFLTISFTYALKVNFDICWSRWKGFVRRQSSKNVAVTIATWKIRCS